MRKILHISGGMNIGGQETFIMNIIRNTDLTKNKIDFVLCNETNYFADELLSLGCNIYTIPPLKKNLISHVIKLYLILKKNKYDVVHRHTSSTVVAIDTLVAKMRRIPVIIAHSHATGSEVPDGINKLFRWLLNKTTTDKIACSEKAGDWLFGKKNFRVIINGINEDDFKFDESKRNYLREAIGIKESEFILGHVGRLSEEKNHKFLIDLAKQIIPEIPDSKIIFVGDGKLKSDLLEYASKLGVSENIIFLGSKINVSDYYNVFDIFLFPSIYEGFGIALLEAQTNGLTCICSDAIQPEVIFNDSKKLSLEHNFWISEIIDKYNKNYNCYRSDFTLPEKYRITNTVKNLEEVYFANTKENKN